MVNYGKPVWEMVLESAKELNLKTFAPIDVIKKVREKNPTVKAVTIRCHVIGMTPDHPSSKHYPSVRKNHPAFQYLGKGRFQLLGEVEPYLDVNRQKPPNEFPKAAEWEKLNEKIINLQANLAPFRIDFVDRDVFKKLCDNLYSDIAGFDNICITGYFSETIRDELEKILQMKRTIRLICPEFAIGSNRDKRNLEALKKLSEAGALVKFNNRLHARMMLAYSSFDNFPTQGLLILGSFDFNTECIGKERYDAGIKTRHPDLLHSVIGFFEKVWNDSESLTLEKFLSDKRK